MIGIIVGLGVAVYLLYLNFKDEKEIVREERSVSGNVFAVIISILVAMLVAVLVDGLFMLPAKALMLKTERTSELVSSQEIISLKDNSQIDGSFFLGCGSINEDEWYVYYTNTEHGYKKNKLNADSLSRPVYLKYTGEDETPRIDEYQLATRKILKEKSIFLSLFAYIKLANYEVGDVVSCRYSTHGYNGTDDVRYEIFIPEGSIKNDYVIDLE